MIISKARKEGYVYVASCSGGKDSLCMTLLLMSLGYPLDYILFYDTGMEFRAVYDVIERLSALATEKGVRFVRLKGERDFLCDMLLRPVCAGTENEHYGYEWCGGACRWQTSCKINAIKKFYQTLPGQVVQYVGIAADEPKRLKNEDNKVYPLNEWGMTESDCLSYCRANGWNWQEKDDDGTRVDLYELFDRVSCWCCKNSNLKELRAMYHHFRNTYWGWLKGMQSHIPRPFHSDSTVFQLEERFEREDAQMSFDDF